MAWQKVDEMHAACLVVLIAARALPDDARIVWKAQQPEDNIIFLATIDSLPDMIPETPQPNDIFEIWSDTESLENKEKI